VVGKGSGVGRYARVGMDGTSLGVGVLPKGRERLLHEQARMTKPVSTAARMSQNFLGVTIAFLL
jgi:hypothetical protein